MYSNKELAKNQFFYFIDRYTLITYNIVMNKFKQLRKQTGLSQSKFAEKYNISVRTLQQWEQGISKPIDSFISLIEKDINKDSNLRYEYKKNNTSWMICIDNPFLNVEKIYPIQQKKVKELIEDISLNNKIKKIIIFGSSVTDKCHIGSDVDIYVESEQEKIKTEKQHNFEYDLWTNKTADERLKKEINKKGVIVYE